VVFESTVYPGVTEEICGPIIAAESCLKASRDFKLGYSPERVNPGDKEHTLERVIKVVSAEDQAALDIVAQVYGSIIEAGVHRAPSIKVAEAAKVIENTQRDLNIALMNELAIIFDHLGISTRDVLEAAGTKWNFLAFKPGLVGGHCIGVDPFYLTTKAEQVGYRPQVILAGRRINDGMGEYIANRTVKLMINSGFQIKASRVGILGLSFKENVSDTRNSRVPDIVHELAEFGVEVMVHDPLANVREVADEYAIELLPWELFTGLDALIMAVPHQAYSDLRAVDIEQRLNPGGVFVDVKSLFRREDFSKSVSYWSL
jgi:UDP-N-acetyl-D-galactosamine dehydrogenase